MDKPTIRDIAREAGVSLATVDRVLNKRPGVREKTRAQVRSAIKRIGYVRDTHAANLARKRRYRFVFVLPEGSGQFVETLKGALKEAYSSQVFDRMVLRVVTVPHHDPHAIVKTIRSLIDETLDGVAIMVPETSQVRDAIGRLKKTGVAVVAFVSDLPNSQRDYFVGIDSVSAGRTAAQLMGRFVGGYGEVLVVTNSMRSRDSLEKRLGFDTVMTSDFPHLTVLPSIESYDDPNRMEEIINKVGTTRPDLVGVYSMGSGNAAMLNALRRCERLEELVVIASELTPITRAELMENNISAIIAQNVGHLMRSSLRILRSLSDQTPIYESQERVRIEIVIKENLC